MCDTVQQDQGKFDFSSIQVCSWDIEMTEAEKAELASIEVQVKIRDYFLSLHGN